MPDSVALFAHVATDLDAALERLAIASGRTKSALVADALRAFVESEQQFADAVAEGLRAYDAGDLVSHDDVVVSVETLLRTT